MRMAGVLLAALVGGSTSADPAAADHQLTLDPDGGPPGTTVTVVDLTCDGYEVVDDEGEVMGSAGPGSTGAVSFTVPDDAEPGDFPVFVSCGDGDGGSTTHVGTFTVESATTTSVAPTTTTSEPEPPATTATTETEIPTSTTLPRVPETIAECEEQANEALARLRYEPQRRMVVGRSSRVQAVLSLGDVPPDVTFESSTTVIEIPDLRCQVEAQLTGPDFDVTPDEPQPQSFVGTLFLRWEWQVRPLRAGDDLKLNLRLQAAVVEGGRTVPGPATFYATDIDVDAEPVSGWTRFTEWLADVFGHPIVPILLVPLAGATFAYARRRLGSGGGAGPSSGPDLVPPAGGAPPPPPAGV